MRKDCAGLRRDYVEIDHDAEDAELLGVMHRAAVARLRDGYHQRVGAAQMMVLAREVNRAAAALDLARRPATDARWH